MSFVLTLQTGFQDFFTFIFCNQKNTSVLLMFLCPFFYRFLLYIWTWLIIQYTPDLPLNSLRSLSSESESIPTRLFSLLTHRLVLFAHSPARSLCSLTGSFSLLTHRLVLFAHSPARSFCSLTGSLALLTRLSRILLLNSSSFAFLTRSCISDT